LRGHEAVVWWVAWSPDGARIVTAAFDETARVWSADGKGEPSILRGHEDQVSSVAWSPDSKQIVTASADKTLRIWSADGAGEPLAPRGGGEPWAGERGAPAGKRIAPAPKDVAAVWSDLEPLHGAEDRRLWAATRYCMPVERRIKLLSLPEATARDHRESC